MMKRPSCSDNKILLGHCSQERIIVMFQQSKYPHVLISNTSEAMQVTLLQYLAIFTLLFFCHGTAEGKAKDSVVLRVFNKDFSITDEELMKLVKKADFESHGYTKEVVTKLVTVSGSDSPRYQKMYHFYKIVSCDKVREVEQEIDTLLQGALGADVGRRLNKDLKMRRLDNPGSKCKAGLEVHFKNSQSCGGKKNRQNCSRFRRGDGDCWICFNVSS